MRCVQHDPPKWLGAHWVENGGPPFSDAAQRTAQALADIEAGATEKSTERVRELEAELANFRAEVERKNDEVY